MALIWCSMGCLWGIATLGLAVIATGGVGAVLGAAWFAAGIGLSVDIACVAEGTKEM